VKVTWKDCPPYWAGAYTTGADGTVKILNEENPPPADYQFILDGQVRSPYFDEKTEGKSREFIAREFNADLEGASTPALDPQAIEKLKGDYAAIPKLRGAITFDEDTHDDAVFHENKNGPLSIWCDFTNAPPADDAYAMGVDVSAGAGASNSVISIFSRSLGHQVAEYVTSTDNAIELAQISKAIGILFGGIEDQALLNFDAQGQTGGAFRKEIKRIGYTNFYRRKTADTNRDKNKKQIGTGTTKGYGDLLMDVLEACNRGDATIRSEACYSEFGEYVWVKGKIEHGGAISGENDAEGRETHGDRAVAAALAWLACESRPFKKHVVEHKQKIPHGSGAWLIKYIEAEDEREQERSDSEFIFG
jgi:hypothetical protein